MFLHRLLVGAVDQMHGHLIAYGGDLVHHAQELDQVADLMESPDVGFADDDAAAALEIVGKQAAVAPALGIFRDHQMLFLQLGSGGRR